MKTRRHDSRHELRMTLGRSGETPAQFERLDNMDTAERESHEWDAMNDEMKARIDRRARSGRRGE